MREDIKKLLVNTYFAFFGRFGDLLPVQRQSIPKVLDGLDLLIVSPSASGKTEAVMAPLAEKLIVERWEPLAILYISPTRALVNDLKERLKVPLEFLGISYARKTQDFREFNPNKPSHVLFTTPESFDSLISRHPYSLENIKALVLDEIHLYDRTYRGDQLRVLIRRLERLVKGGFQTIALSATVSSPSEVGARYLNPGFQMVLNLQVREIDYQLFRWTGEFKEILDVFDRRGIKKALFFANTRREVEEIAINLKREWRYPHYIWTHHASLSKKERQSTEDLMLRSRYGIVVATPTLELGIDIGDIDAVVLMGAPASVASLLQRIGRGNRRSQKVIAYGFYRTNFEKIFFELLFEKAKEGWIEDMRYHPRVSVAVQQIFSYVYQRKRVGAPISVFEDVLSVLALNRYEIKEILSHLVEEGFLKKEGPELFYPDERLFRLASRGWIHSNIEDIPSEYEVYDVETGNKIGTIEVVAPTFVLEGKTWGLVKVQRNRVFARVLKGIEPKGGKVFKGKGTALWPPALGIELKKKIFPGAQDNHMIFVPYGDNILIFHFLGVLHGFLWAETLTREGIAAKDHIGIALVVERLPQINKLFEIPLEILDETAEEIWIGVKNLLGLGQFFRYLPEDMKMVAVKRAFLTEELAGYLWTSEPVSIGTLGPPAVDINELI